MTIESADHVQGPKQPPPWKLMLVTGLLGATIGAGCSMLITGLGPSQSDLDNARAAATEARTQRDQALNNPSVPQGCLDAIAAAEEIARITGRFASLTGRLADNSKAAVLAAGTGDSAALEAASSREGDINADLGQVNKDIDAPISAFMAGRSECQAGH